MWRPLLIAFASVAACAEPMPDRLALPKDSRYPYDDCDLAADVRHPAEEP
jgi:hypothetical protein